MKYNGGIAKIYDEGENKIFLFLIDPKTKKVKDGINISDDSDIYQDLTYDLLQIVEVKLKDGTLDAKINLDDFVNAKYGRYDIFIHIKDINSYKLAKNVNDKLEPRTVEETILDGEFESVLSECIELSNNEYDNIIKINKKLDV